MTVIESYDQNGVSQTWDDDTATFTDLRAVGAVGGPVSRPYTDQENAEAAVRAAARARTQNEATIRARAADALQANRDFLALDPPTQAQVLEQVRALTRQNIGLIRLQLTDLEGTL